MNNVFQTPYSLIVGLGATGLSVAHYLFKHKRNFVVADTRSHPPYYNEFSKQFPTIPLFLGSIDENLLLQAKEIIVSPGLALNDPLFKHSRAQGVPHIGDIELFAREAQAPIIAITGSNGKSTVTSLVGHLLKEAGLKVHLGGNLGTPALDLLNQPLPDWYVLECSSFQLETTFSLQNHIACVLNITEDHLDRYLGFTDYVAAKQRIYHHCKAAVFNQDDPYTFPATHDSPLQTFSFTSNCPTESENQFGFLKEIYKNQSIYWIVKGQQRIISSSELHLHGTHNYMNVAAALAIGTAANCPLKSLLPGLRSFKGLAHRCEWVSSKNHVDWYNDSKGTNIGATIAALIGLGGSISGKILLIAGGQGKGADFSVLVPYLKAYIRNVFLLGEDAPLLEKAFQGCCNIYRVNDLEEAVYQASLQAKPSDAVLLSPACASLDMFKNFEDRGEQFKFYVKKLHAT